MKKMYKTIALLLLFSLIMVLASACSSGDGKEASSSKDKNENNIKNEENENEEEILEPVTIKMWSWMGDEQFEEHYKKPVEEKYDHITFELVSGGPDQTTIEELLVAGEKPDIIWGGAPWQIQLFDEFELTGDMTDLIEKFDYTYDHLDPGGIQDVSKFFNKGEFNALPLFVPRMALHYNKDIFDLFGQDYPTDNMTWDEVISLAAKVTGERDGTQYTGIGFDENNFLGMSLGAPMLDAETHEPIISKSESWKRMLNAIDRIYSIPGNLPEAMAEGEAFYHSGYFGAGSLAMLPTWFAGGYVNVEGLNWDAVTYPVWEDSIDQAPLTGSQWIGLSGTSEHREDAFRALTHLLSEENLVDFYTENLSIAQIPLGDIDVISNIAPHPDLGDIDYMSVFKHTLNPGTEEISEYEGDIGRLPDTQIPKHIIFSDQDINTAIRKIEEWATQELMDVIGGE